MSSGFCSSRERKGICTQCHATCSVVACGAIASIRFVCACKLSIHLSETAANVILAAQDNRQGMSSKARVPYANNRI